MKPYLVLFVLAAACSNSTKYTVGGHTLVLKDSGYTTTEGRYCTTAAAGQLRVDFVDFDPICGGTIAANDDGGARDPQLEHNVLELIYVTSTQDDPKVPFEVSVPDCDNVGPAGPGIAYFKHYASGSEMPEITAAQSGQLFLSSLDPTDLKPATGSFDLDFGAGGKIAGTFSTYTCNPPH